jgi:hypothetical protein
VVGGVVREEVVEVLHVVVEAVVVIRPASSVAATRPASTRRQEQHSHDREQQQSGEFGLVH